MLRKLPFWAVILEVLVCFIPISLLWLLGCSMLVVLLFTERVELFLLPSAILLLLGGVGLVGIFQITIHLYYYPYQPATTTVYRNLYAGILSLSLLTGYMIFGTGSILSPMLIVFLMPIICSFHLISITKKSEPQSESPVFNDA